jgi:hypothetical protein
MGEILYNARAVDPTLLVPLSTLASQLSTSKSATIYAISHLLDYIVLTLNPQSDTMHLTRSLKFTVMHLTSLSPGLSHKLEVTSTLVTEQNHPPNP